MFKATVPDLDDPSLTPTTNNITITNDAESTADLAAGEYSRLDLVSLQLSGPDASYFSLGNFSAQYLSALQSGTLPVSFSPDHAGTYDAQLVVTTDIDAPINTAGDTYTIDLTATASVPEPTSAALLGCGWVGLLARMRRRPAR